MNKIITVYMAGCKALGTSTAEECLDENIMDREIKKDFFYPSHKAQVTLSHLSSYRPLFFRKRGHGTP